MSPIKISHGSTESIKALKQKGALVIKTGEGTRQIGATRNVGLQCQAKTDPIVARCLFTLSRRKLSGRPTSSKRRAPTNCQQQIHLSEVDPSLPGMFVQKKSSGDQVLQLTSDEHRTDNDTPCSSCASCQRDAIVLQCKSKQLAQAVENVEQCMTRLQMKDHR